MQQEALYQEWTDNEVADAIKAVPCHFSATQMPDLKTACLRQLTIPPRPVCAAPTTTPTVAATGGGSSGGSLAAGTWFVKYTFVTNGGYESPGSPESSSFSVSSGNVPRVTLPALPPGVVSINLYATKGASGTEQLYATGITATTYDMSSAAPATAGKLSPIGVAASAISVNATAGGTTGGSLQQGAYYFQITQVTSGGVESSPSPEVGPVIVAAGNIPQISLPALGSGFTTFNIYLSPANGASGTEQQYAGGVTGSTFNCSAAASGVGNAPPPLAPTVTPTVAPTGGGSSGGTLGAANYYTKYSFVGANGLESSPSPESAQFTVGSGNIPTVTMQALPAGVVGIKVYLTEAGGAQNSEKLYSNPQVLITSTTYNLDTDVYTKASAVPPSGAFAGNPCDMSNTSGSVAMFVDVGYISGAPTAIVVALQESDDGQSWAAVLDSAQTITSLVSEGAPNPPGFGGPTTIPNSSLFGAAETVNEWKRSKKFMRATVAFTGGTNPVANMSVSLISRRLITGPLPNPPAGYSPYPNVA